MLGASAALQCASLRFAPAAEAYLWKPNGCLPRAGSERADGMLHCLFSVRAHCLLSRVSVYNVCLCLLLA